MQSIDFFASKKRFDNLGSASTFTMSLIYSINVEEAKAKDK